MLGRTFNRVQLAAGGISLRVGNPHVWILIVMLGSIAWLYNYRIFPHSIDYSFLTKFGLFEYENHINGTLFIIPFLYAIVFLSWRGSIVIWVISAVIALPRMLGLLYSPTAWLTNLAFGFTPLLIVVFVNLEIGWRRKEKALMAEHQEERNRFLQQVLKAQELERQRIAQEIHDDTLQVILGIANKAQSLVGDKYSKTVPPEYIQEVKWIRDTTAEVGQELRKLSLNLRPSILDNMGLIPAVRFLAERLRTEYGIEIDVMITGAVRKLGEDDVTVFRLIQEALRNVRRHSKASKVFVILEFGPKSVKIKVQDNGIGFSLPSKLADFVRDGRLGLVGMQERVQFRGGNFDVISGPGMGTTLLLELNC